MMLWWASDEESAFLSHLQRIGTRNLRFAVHFVHTIEEPLHEETTAEKLWRVKVCNILAGTCRTVNIEMGLAVELEPEAGCIVSEGFLNRTRRAVGDAAARMVGGKVLGTETRWIMSKKLVIPLLPSFRYERC